jgi:hypothetical protein
MVSRGLVVQEGLGGGDVGGGVGGGHFEGGFGCSRRKLLFHTFNGLEREERGLDDVS